MKRHAIPSLLIAWALACAATGVAAQSSSGQLRLDADSTQGLQARTAQDQALVQRNDAQRSVLENGVKDYLVPLRAWDGRSRPPVGVSLLANGSGPVDMVWDTTSQSLVAQWRLVQKTDSGQRLYYTTSVRESGAVNFSISSRF